VLALRDAFLDCDGDAILLLVEPSGPTCHTGAESCFFRAATGAASSGGRDEHAPGARPHAFASKLEATLVGRANASSATSYTRRLLDEGAGKIGEKIREEADELARAIANEPADRVVSEAADMVYHVLVGLISRSVAWRAVLGELATRFGVGGLVEKARRGESDPGRGG
jgi:phosphoribosyl-ATP pyrophosphohydrolase/phosphoribosyl-AMP cyclohydrolase